MAIRHFKLSPSVKTYGDPENLTTDADVELVVCCNRVDVHYPTVVSILRAGKRVFVEWPLAESVDKARELVKIAEEAGVDSRKCLMGLQSRVSPLTLHIKNVLESGLIGTVLSSQATAFGHLLPRGSLPETLKYFTERKNTSGNSIFGVKGHALDYMHHVLGEFGDFDARMQIQRPTLKLFDVSRNTTGFVATDVPDLFSIYGKLKQSGGKIKIAAGATFTQTFRLGPPFKSQPATMWVYCRDLGRAFHCGSGTPPPLTHG